MITIVATLLIGFQSAGEAAVDVLPEDPETWVLEYPVVLKPYVQDYYGCLQAGVKHISGRPNFEAQHREDIPRCVEEGAEIERKANEALGRLDMAAATTPEDVAHIFEVIRHIHIERGRDIDRQFLIRLADNQMPAPSADKDDEETSNPPPQQEYATGEKSELPTNRP